jgi:hypothetical protein
MTPEDIKTARQMQHKFSVLLSNYQVYGPNDEIAGDIFEAACYIKDYLTIALSTVEAHQAELDRVRREARIEVLEEAVKAELAIEFFNWFWYNEVIFPERRAYRLAIDWTAYEAEWRSVGCIPKYFSIPVIEAADQGDPEEGG